MKKKFGFTLTEILITLGIIGVVAALTTPAYVRNSANAKVGPTLAKFVNSMEIACEQMLLGEMYSKLSSIAPANGTDANYKLFMETLSKYLIMTEVDKKYIFYTPDGTKYGERNSTWQMKDGSVLNILTSANLAGLTLKGDYVGAYKTPYHILMYDINGFAGNNKAGKEVFGFIIDDAGNVIPMGSKTSRKIYNFDDLPYKTCSEIATSTDADSKLIAGLSCSGEIYENGWKVVD